LADLDVFPAHVSCWRIAITFSSTEFAKTWCRFFAYCTPQDSGHRINPHGIDLRLAGLAVVIRLN
jgi:hypothetical protein